MTLMHSVSPFWPNEGWHTRTMPHLDGVSDSCYGAAAKFVNCTMIANQPGEIPDYQAMCATCSDTYSAFDSSCTQSDYKSDFRMLTANLACHKESNNYCTSTLTSQFDCDPCGQYISKQFTITNNLYAIRPLNASTVQQCAGNTTTPSNSTSTPPTGYSSSASYFDLVTIIGLTIISFK